VAPSRQIIRNSPGQWEGNTIIVKGDNHANRITIDQYWWGELRINVSRIGDDFEAAAFSHEWQPRVARDAVLKIYGLDGNDEIINRSNLRTYIYAGDGHDRVVTGSNGHFVFGGSGNDAIYGGAGGDYLNGNDGHDLLYGEGAIDILVGGNDNDILYGGDSHDVLYGQAGRDLLYGGIGDDTLRGGSGNDDLYGSSGYDRLYGDSGRDRLDGGFDGTRDYLHGGSGLNTFVQHRDWSNRVEQEQWADYPASTVTVDPYAFLGSMSLLPLIV
jgi:Ca2+-binding RTX toxin-like protein